MADPALLPKPPASAEGIDACMAMRVRRLTRRVTQLYDEALAPHGLTVGQLGILAALKRRQAIGIGALAERLSSDASTVSRLLRPLEAAGLLSLGPDPDDGRAKAVRLTDDGAARLRAAAPAWAGAQAAMADKLGPSRLAALRFMLDDAFDHLKI